jgi:hypothetical protein
VQRQETLHHLATVMSQNKVMKFIIVVLDVGLIAAECFIEMLVNMISVKISLGISNVLEGD